MSKRDATGQSLCPLVYVDHTIRFQLTAIPVGLWSGLSWFNWWVSFTPDFQCCCFCKSSCLFCLGFSFGFRGRTGGEGWSTAGWLGWLVGCFGFSGPLRQYFSLYRAVSQREGERRERIEESKNVQTTPPPPPPATTAGTVGPCPTIIKIVGRPGTGIFPRTIAPPDHTRLVGPPGDFVAGRSRPALLFWFFGGLGCCVLLFMVFLVIYKYKNR